MEEVTGGLMSYPVRYPRGRTASMFLVVALGIVLLVVGDWHFVSDVIAGTPLSFTAGLIAGELWVSHALTGSEILEFPLKGQAGKKDRELVMLFRVRLFPLVKCLANSNATGEKRSYFTENFPLLI